MKRTSIFLLISLLLSCNETKKDIIPSMEKVIFDTDMGPDFDDVGAIAVLHALADGGECEILATLSCNSYPVLLLPSKRSIVFMEKRICRLASLIKPELTLLRTITGMTPCFQNLLLI